MRTSPDQNQQHGQTHTAAVVSGDRQTPGAQPDTALTEETQKQLERGVSPVSDDPSAEAERAVANEPAASARNRWAADRGQDDDLRARVDALEVDLAKLRGQLRHSL